LKNAKNDAEVQKLAGSLQEAETALIDLDDMVDTAHQQLEWWRSYTAFSPPRLLHRLFRLQVSPRAREVISD
jgi:hypothetical protein